LRLIFKILIGAVIVLLAAFGYMFWAITAENPSTVTQLNPQSSLPKALVISDPGITDFESRVASAFAQGLTANWHVEVTTASSQTPIDLSSYSLVVLSSPIYGGQPSVPLQSYLTRLGSLEGLRVVSLLTGAGASEEAKAWITTKVQSMGGLEVMSLVLTSMASNPPIHGLTDPIAIATKAAQNLI
jgi:hypothetical protein